ncbi:hypothetical protein FB451DRAFT_442634 [Mycena latifolia]|nr:hypothetical protein FB451DRAFT_442634 [Mycena latifolia]
MDALVPIDLNNLPPRSITGLYVVTRVPTSTQTEKLPSSGPSYETVSDPQTELQVPACETGILRGKTRPIVLSNIRQGVWDPQDGREPIELNEIIGFPCTSFSNGTAIPPGLEENYQSLARHIPFAAAGTALPLPGDLAHLDDNRKESELSPLTLKTRTGESYISPTRQWLYAVPIRFRMKRTTPIKSPPEHVSLLQYEELTRFTISTYSREDDHHAINFGNIWRMTRDDGYWGREDGGGTWIPGMGARSPFTDQVEYPVIDGDIRWQNWQCTPPPQPDVSREPYNRGIGMEYTNWINSSYTTLDSYRSKSVETWSLGCEDSGASTPALPSPTDPLPRTNSLQPPMNPLPPRPKKGKRKLSLLVKRFFQFLMRQTAKLRTV